MRSLNEFIALTVYVSLPYSKIQKHLFKGTTKSFHFVELAKHDLRIYQVQKQVSVLKPHSLHNAEKEIYSLVYDVG